jgi:ABC-type cobalamin/Fe3+-siderophores transport system ATPase subunit
MRERAVIEAVRVAGTGFLEAVSIDFSSALNTIIGARGTGKTSILELIRYALGLDADRSHDKRLADLVPFVLGDSGSVELDLTSHLGEAITIRRGRDGEATISDRSGNPLQVIWPPFGMHDVEVYSQNDLEQVAQSAEDRLRTLDARCGDELTRVQADVRDLRGRLETNAMQILQLGNEIEELTAQAEQLPKLQVELVQIENQYQQAMLTLKGQDLDKKRIDELSSSRQAISREESLLSTLKAEAESALLEPFPGRRLGERLRQSLAEDTIAQLPHSARLRTLRLHAAEAAQTFAQQREEMMRQLEVIRDNIATAQVQTVTELQAVSSEYQKLADRFGQQDRAWKEISGRRDVLLSRLRTLQSAVDGATQRDAQMNELRQERTALLQRLHTARHDRFLSRRKAANELTDAIAGTVRVRVEESGALEQYEKFLLEALKGSGMWYSRLSAEIAHVIPPRRLAELARGGDSETLSELVAIDGGRARKALTALNESRVINQLDALDIDDTVKFELRVADGSFQQSDTLSQGQKCTTMLSILLVDSTSPLVIDQPEDNLDNSYVVESVVEVVRRQKSDRQFIFVTHNPNIPVLGEAERVIAMEATLENKGRPVCGRWDEAKIRRRIVDVMEGGDEAFKRRSQAYGFTSA